MKKYVRTLTLATTAIIMLTNSSCAIAADTIETTVSTAVTANAATQVPATAADRSAPATAATITFDGSTVNINGSGASLEGSVLTITQEGSYVLKGTWDDGQICINAKDAEVWLVLDGVNLTSSTSAPIHNQKTGEFVVKLNDGTQNYLTDGQVYAYPDAATDEPDAALFSKNDMEITGNGSLSVTANFNNGIGTKDDLIISGGNINITSANHGIRGRDSITVTDGSLVIHSGSDGMQSNNDENAEKGWITLYGGSFDITAARDGIQAENAFTINGGDYKIVSGGGGSADLTTLSAEESYKGIKAGADIIVNDGSFHLDNADDSIHSNTNVTINGGNFDISTGDDGIHAEETLVVNNGTINITKSYEGLEGANITVNGGVIDIVSSDDAINSAGGSGNGMNAMGGGFGEMGGNRPERQQMEMNGEAMAPPEGFEGQPPQGGMSPPDRMQDGNVMPRQNDTAKTEQNTGGFGADRFGVSGDYWLKITGGKITMDAGFDGLDSNGNIDMTGGEVYISCRGGGGDGAMDYDGVFTLTGGTMIAVGLSGLTPTTSSASTQPSIALYYTQTQKAGTEIAIVDAKGNVLATYKPTKDFTSAAFTHSDFAEGSVYTITADGIEVTKATIGSSSTTSISDTGEAVTGNMGGRGGGRNWQQDNQNPQNALPNDA